MADVDVSFTFDRQYEDNAKWLTVGCQFDKVYVINKGDEQKRLKQSDRDLMGGGNKDGVL